MSTVTNLDELAAAFIAGHDGGPLIDSVPDALTPADMPAVYALQDKVIAQLGAVGGWKVMAGGEGDPICAPIPANRYFFDGDTLSSAHHNFVLAEIEVAVKLGADLPSGSNTDAVDAAIESLHPAIEMVGSPFVDRDTIAHNTKLGDLQSNGAVIVGPQFDASIKGSLATLGVTLELDGTEVKSTTSGASYDAILKAVSWLSTHAAARGLSLKAGDVIITGSRVLAPHGTAKTIAGKMGDWGSVVASFTY